VERPREDVLPSRLIAASPVYYGWIIVGAGIIGRIMTSPGQTYSFSIFIEHFIADLGVSRSLVSTLYTFGTMGAALTLPFVGRQLDRRGPRVMVGVITALFALSVIYMSAVRSAAMLALGFFLLRSLGQGSLSMVSTNVISNWWVRRRGAILGIAGVVSSLVGNGIYPSAVHGLIGRFGWRTSYLILGLGLAGIMLPLGVALYRRRPEEYGLLPDAAQSVPDASGVGAPLEEEWTRSEALRTGAFWIISIGIATIAALATGLQFHQVSIFADSGLAPAVAAAAYMPISAAQAGAMLLSGVLIDRVQARYLLSASLVGLAASLLLAPRLTGSVSALLYGAILGLTVGLQNTVLQAVWPKYFGRKHMGAIAGVSTLIVIGGSSLGPLPMGVARDAMGSYLGALSVAAALPAALAVLALFARRPRKSYGPSVHGDRIGV
jgi:sugar phosphate permease